MIQSLHKQTTSTSNGSKVRLFSTRPVFVLSDQSHEPLAKSIVSVCKEWQDNATRDKLIHETRSIVYKDTVVWKTFHDGFPDLFIKNVKEIAGKDIIFVASFHSVDVIFAQISLIYQIPRYLAHSCTVILPYFPTGTMERIDREGQIATAKTLATILSEIPPTARGPTQIMIFDIHALQERFYFKDSVIPRLETAIPLIVEVVKQKYVPENLRFMIVFPDDGAEKRFSHSFPDDWPKVAFLKKRDGDKRSLELKDTSAIPQLKGSHTIIIDDLVQTGGTLLEAGKELKKLEVASVNAFVTHSVFPNESWKKFTDQAGQKSIFENFWITDSIPHARRIADNAPFRLLSLAPLIGQILLGFDLKSMV